MSDALIIFTDLDGTLLNHHDYSFAAAQEAINELNRRDIPWILNSSKTLAEMRHLRSALGQRHPLIVENGAGIAMDADYRHPLWSPEVMADTREQDGMRFHATGAPRAAILDALRPLKRRYPFTGFADMDVAELCRHTGLMANAAERAMQRHFSEPLLWQGSPAQLAAFSDDITAAGLHLLRGGRFIHVMGNGDKGAAMQWLLRGFNRHPAVRTLALGDSDNDCAMLRLADRAVIVRSPVNAPPQLNDHPDCSITGECAPAGWNRAVLDAIHELPADTAEKKENNHV